MAVARRRLLKKPKPVTREEDKDMIPLRDLGDAANAALAERQIDEDPEAIAVAPTKTNSPPPPLPAIIEEADVDIHEPPTL
jgi:hypothetical protein